MKTMIKMMIMMIMMTMIKLMMMMMMIGSTCRGPASEQLVEVELIPASFKIGLKFNLEFNLEYEEYKEFYHLSHICLSWFQPPLNLV